MKAHEAYSPLPTRSASRAIASQRYVGMVPNLVLPVITFFVIAGTLGAQEIPGGVATASSAIDYPVQTSSTGGGLSSHTTFLLRTWSNLHYAPKGPVENVDLMGISLFLGAEALGAEAEDAATPPTEESVARVPKRQEARWPSEHGHQVATANANGTGNRLLLFLLIGAVPILAGLAAHRLITLHRLGAAKRSLFSLANVAWQFLVNRWSGLSHRLGRLARSSSAASFRAPKNRSGPGRNDTDSSPQSHPDLLLYVIENNVELRKLAS